MIGTEPLTAMGGTTSGLGAGPRRFGRRRFVALAAVGAVAARPRRAEAQGATPAAGATRDFVDVTGEAVRVPNRPERIVAIHDINAGAQVLSLGGPLIGMPTRGGEVREDVARYFDLAGVADIGEVYEPSVETIVGLKPDLIVAEGYDGQIGGADGATLDRLRTIAPVVAIDTFRPVELVMADYAELLGEAATVDLGEQRRGFEADLEELRGLRGEEGWGDVTASLIGSNTGGLEAWGPTALVPLDILSRVGVTWVDIMEEAARPEHGGYIGGVSFERLPEFAADLVLVQTAYEPEILDNPLYRGLAAVEAGQVVELPEPYAGTHYPNYRYVVGVLLDALRGQDLRTDLV